MRDLSDRRFWAWVRIIAVVSLVWQSLFIMIWRRDYFVWGDAYFYYESGKQLADGVGWQNPFLYKEFGVIQPAADHPPLYILFLGFWAFVGLDGPIEQMLLTSLCIGVPLIVMSALVGRELRSRRLGVFCAASVAVYPGVWAWEGTLLSEPLAMLGLVTTVYLAYRFWHRPSLWLAAALGVALTFAAFGRAELLLMSVAVVVPLTLRTPGWEWNRRVVALVLAGATCIITLAPWVAYNLSRFEEPVYVSEGYQVTLATSTCDDTYFGSGTGYWSIRCPQQYLEAAGLTATNSDQSERSAVMFDGSVEYIGEHLDRVPTVVAARWARITGFWKPMEQARTDAFLEGRNYWVTLLAQGSWYPFAAAGVGGLFVLRRRGETVLPLVGPLVVVLITVTITFGQNRYRASIEPAVAIMAAVAAEAAWAWFCRVRDDPADALPAPDTAH